MKIQEVIDKILAYHPELTVTPEHPTCDGFKCGDPEAECTGIVTSIAASVDVIRKAIDLGANLIIVHEPTFYTHMDKTDWLEHNEVYLEKRALLDSHGIAVWRDHDHIHRHRPDGIAYGNMMELGWKDYLVGDPETVGFRSHYRLPKQTVRALAETLKEKMGLNAVRVIGNLDAEIETVAFTGHLPFEDEHASTDKANDGMDVLIPGETIDWTALSYMRDAGQLGKTKAIIAVGHMNAEELGMKYAVNWIGDLIGHALPVTFVRAADMYQYV